MHHSSRTRGSKARTWNRANPSIVAHDRTPAERATLALLSIAILAVGAPIVTVLRLLEQRSPRSGPRAV